MIIKSITLKNFRNHANYQLDCSKNTTLILGKNGYGKTSVLEAIYILTQGKSFRATDPEIIKRGADFYYISLTYKNGEEISASYNQKAKTYKIKDQKPHRLPSKSKYPVVLFLPSDLNLISGSPGRRREYFDRFLSTLSQDYAKALTKYNKALSQRNKLLKEPTIDQNSIFPWNVLLAKNGIILKNYREDFINRINQTLTKVYRSISENQDEVKINYSTEFPELTENQYLGFLEKNYQKDQILGHTSFGVHKDDFEFIFNQSSADGSSSRGETRSIILALKFIEASIITDTLLKKPIILLDDVFSELDEKRRQALIENFKDHQIIITSVENVSDKLKISR